MAEPVSDRPWIDSCLRDAGPTDRKAPMSQRGTCGRPKDEGNSDDQSDESQRRDYGQERWRPAAGHGAMGKRSPSARFLAAGADGHEPRVTPETSTAEAEADT
jgi:hypothetical protein